MIFNVEFDVGTEVLTPDNEIGKVIKFVITYNGYQTDMFYYIELLDKPNSLQGYKELELKLYEDPTLEKRAKEIVAAKLKKGCRWFNFDVSHDGTINFKFDDEEGYIHRDYVWILSTNSYRYVMKYLKQEDQREKYDV